VIATEINNSAMNGGICTPEYNQFCRKDHYSGALRGGGKAAGFADVRNRKAVSLRSFGVAETSGGVPPAIKIDFRD